LLELVDVEKFGRDEGSSRSEVVGWYESVSWDEGVDVDEGFGGHERILGARFSTDVGVYVRRTHFELMRVKHNEPIRIQVLLRSNNSYSLCRLEIHQATPNNAAPAQIGALVAQESPSTRSAMA
jgi:hypothetical protein